MSRIDALHNLNIPYQINTLGVKVQNECLTSIKLTLHT